ncbi:PREDICTED: uncharacterized protein LOC108370640 isoform X1 [Rhagoletis zephyria]|uniref:uncharacterized protein LOC108370640 isoform X1 n=1 Tax=Rhagoletis zephyria TaxID=28612 RepID=UPI0008112D05|nr:PREDICTED: uncharacterized protein LOC108370640 isoform X1 [Rhagoletis zephyria]XP_017481503.1 PREDICTED: uncharacterized protein LOC108370640 isoform X1 [Rhagoletis zephyria]
MSEVENTQETNGTSNGDVPEIELIIKEEYMLDNEFVGNTNESRINIVATDENSSDVDEKENIVQSKVQPKQQSHQHLKEQKAVNNEKPPLSSRKDILPMHHNESVESDRVLMLTHYDNQHFHFEYVKPKQEENILHTEAIQQSDNFNNERLEDRLSLSQLNRVPFSPNRITEEITVKDKNARGSSPVSNLDFAAMVAEACEGIFDEIENDLRSYNDDSDNNIVEPSTDAGCCGDVANRKKRQHNSEAVRLAANAVLEDGISLGEAAKRFNVVRSTVSSRVAKHPKRKRRKPNKELEELIQSKLKAGVQISEIARALHVPKSTVHLHKTRLKNNGLLPPVWIRNGNKDVVDHGAQERLKQAYRGHVVNGMSVRFAAEFFSLPLTTLWRFIKRRKNATTAAVNERSAECAVEELSNGLEEIGVHNACDAFEDLGIKEESLEKEMNLPDKSATCSANLVTIIDSEEESLEQSLMNQLLE